MKYIFFLIGPFVVLYTMQSLLPQPTYDDVYQAGGDVYNRRDFYADGCRPKMENYQAYNEMKTYQATNEMKNYQAYEKIENCRTFNLLPANFGLFDDEEILPLAR